MTFQPGLEKVKTLLSENKHLEAKQELQNFFESKNIYFNQKQLDSILTKVLNDESY